MKKNRRQDVSIELYKMAKNGASVHQIMNSLPVSFEDAERAIKQVAEDNKEAGPSHRANLRNLVREQAPGALKIISEIALNTKEKTVFRLKAAELLLKFAADYMDETVMRSWQERPDTSVETQPTIFDFGPVCSEKGEISFRGETRLMIVPNDD